MKFIYSHKFVDALMAWNLYISTNLSMRSWHEIYILQQNCWCALGMKFIYIPTKLWMRPWHEIYIFRQNCRCALGMKFIYSDTIVDAPLAWKDKSSRCAHGMKFIYSDSIVDALNGMNFIYSGAFSSHYIVDFFLSSAQNFSGTNYVWCVWKT